MKAMSRIRVSVVALALGFGLVASANQQLKVKMQAMGASFKSINASIRVIKGTPTLSHDDVWASIVKEGKNMATLAEDSKTLYPTAVVGNAALERDFRDTLEDLRKAIAEKLVKNAEQKELALLEKAAREVNDKRLAAHKKFME